MKRAAAVPQEWLEDALARANGRRKSRRLEAAQLQTLIAEAIATPTGIAFIHGGETGDARSKTTVALAVRLDAQVVLGVAEAVAQQPTPARAWSELAPWNLYQPFANHPRCLTWASRRAEDRVRLPLEEVRAPPGDDGEALLDAVRAAPDDDAPRLVYADWLTERGDARGEFISVQIQRAREPGNLALAEREAVLLSEHEDRWRGQLGDDVVNAVFRRGFVDEVTLHARAFVELGPKLFELAPVRVLRLVDLTPDDAFALAASEDLTRIKTLRVSNSRGSAERALGFEGLSALLGSRNLRHLEGLELEGQHLDDLGAMTLAKMGPPSLPALKRLKLAGDQISSMGASALGVTRWFRHLESVSFRTNSLHAEGAAAIAYVPGAVKWRSLELDGNHLSDEGARVLADSARLAGLEELSLRRNGIGPAGGQALFDSPHLTALRALHLDGNRVGPFLLDRLAKRFKTLE